MSTQRRVLVVDDEVVFLETLKKVLTARGFQVETAADGVSALAWLEDHECDVVILDQRMPGMDGMAVLERLRKRFPILPVLILTGYADMDVALDSVDQGAMEFMLKPTNVEKLSAKIEAALERKRTLEELSS